MFLLTINHGATVPPTANAVSLTITETAAAELRRITPSATAAAVLTPSETAAPQHTEIDPATLTAVAGLVVTENSDWTPVEHDFDGVTMVLVPAGCFDMGTVDGAPDEKPVAHVCLDAPYWIDKTEVTQAQFAAHGGIKPNPDTFTGDNRPIENVYWWNARKYCNTRGGRLPTEGEWEYAARGPDSLIYPWGNEFISDNVVYGENSGAQTADVGSRPSGDTWVGAQDMIGNVWEWTISQFLPYPYDPADGRNVDTESRLDVFHSLRGGSWRFAADFQRAAFRIGTVHETAADYGVRCARSFEEEAEG
jgi:formylglycine-generating enzyme required for sulfatase activity